MQVNLKDTTEKGLCYVFTDGNRSEEFSEEEYKAFNKLNIKASREDNSFEFKPIFEA